MENNKLNILMDLAEQFNLSYNVITNIFNHNSNINITNILDNHIINNNHKLIVHFLSHNKLYLKNKKEVWVIIIISNNTINKPPTITCNIMTKLYTDLGTQDLNFYYNQNIFNEGLHILINFFELNNDSSSSDVDMLDAFSDDNLVDMIVA